MSETLTGGCRCGAIRYSVESAIRNSICHCRDCQRSAGAPLVEWMLADETALAVTGEPVEFESAPGAVRSFCGCCGTGLFYRNAAIPRPGRHPDRDPRSSGRSAIARGAGPDCRAARVNRPAGLDSSVRALSRMRGGRDPRDPGQLI